MSQIDPVSAALGRIESKMDALSEKVGDVHSMAAKNSERITALEHTAIESKARRAGYILGVGSVAGVVGAKAEMVVNAIKNMWGA